MPKSHCAAGSCNSSVKSPSLPWKANFSFHTVRVQYKTCEIASPNKSVKASLNWRWAIWISRFRSSDKISLDITSSNFWIRKSISKLLVKWAVHACTTAQLPSDCFLTNGELLTGSCSPDTTAFKLWGYEYVKRIFLGLGSKRFGFFSTEPSGKTVSSTGEVLCILYS